MLFRSFACSHRSGISACDRALPQPSPRDRADLSAILLLTYQTAWVQVRAPASGLFSSCICFVFCGKRMVGTEAARNMCMVQPCPRLSHSLAPQCLMKQLLLSPLPSALLTENVSLRGSESLFSFSHPHLTTIMPLKRPARELGLPHIDKASQLHCALCWARGWGQMASDNWQCFACYHQWKPIF